MPDTVMLHPKDARAIGQGHPWVYREAIAEKPRKLRTGAVVDLAGPGRPFLGRGIYDAGASIAVRVWTRDPAERIESALVQARVREALRLRELVAVAERTDAYRIVNAEGDRLPGLLVDRWGEWLSVELQTPALERLLPDIVAAVDAAVPSRGIYVRDEARSVLAVGEKCPQEIEVREPTGTFAVRLAEPGKPGLFPDMREARALLAPLCRGRRFLNLFAHTGAFSAAAAAAGAEEVVSVDLSRRWLEHARRNVERNAKDARHEVVVADVFETLRRFAAERRRFDVVLCDPPSFSTSRQKGAFSVRDDYRPLVRAALRVLEPGGLLACATNFRGLTREQFLRMLHDAAQLEPAELTVLTQLGLPPDHPVPAILPEAGYLQFVLAAPVGPGPVRSR